MAAGMVDLFLNGLSPKTTPLLEDHRSFGHLPAELLKSLGRERGLRLTKDLSNDYHFKGYCLGGSITILSIALHQDDINTERISKSFHASLKNVITLQKLQIEFAGINGKYSKKAVNFFSDLFMSWLTKKTFIELPYQFQQKTDVQLLYTHIVHYLMEGRQTPMRKFILDALEEKNGGINENLYALVLEVTGCYDKITTPSLHSFHHLKQDILNELGSLCGIEFSEAYSSFGSRADLIDNLMKLSFGSYQLSRSCHTCVYFKRKQGNWLWDCHYGFKKIQPGDEGLKKLTRIIKAHFSNGRSWNRIYMAVKN